MWLQRQLDDTHVKRISSIYDLYWCHSKSLQKGSRRLFLTSLKKIEIEGFADRLRFHIQYERAESLLGKL